METSWLEFLSPYIFDFVFPILERLLILAFVAMATMFVRWWKNLTIERWIKDIIVEGILYAQEKFWDKEGKERFAYAKLYILKRIEEKWFISIPEERLDALIDSLVKHLKGEFAELWYNNPPQ